MRANGAPGVSGHRAYVFGPFVADTVTRRLWRDGHPVPVTAKMFEVLAVLLEHRDRVVTKDELLERVWPDTAVQENNLARQVSSLRRALGQRPEDADYVLTVSGQGYRFVADAQPIDELPGGISDANGVHPVAPPEPPVETEHSPAGNAPATALPVPVPHGDREMPPTASPNRLRWAATTAALAVLALAIAVGATFVRPFGTGRDTQPALKRVTFDDAALSRDGAWSPDGQWIVFVRDRDGGTDLWKQRIGEPDPVRLTVSNDGKSQPDWSPDGQSIVFRSERDGGGLFVVPADGGAERIVSSFGYEPRWSPDGGRILFKRSMILPDLPALYVVGLDGRPAQSLRPEILARFRSLQAAWHPDGRRVSFWGTDHSGRPTFLNVPADGGSPDVARIAGSVQTRFPDMIPRRFAWARSGRHIYFEATAGETKNIWRITIEPSTGQLTAGPVRLTTGTGIETNVAVSPDGRRILFTSSTSRTRLWAFPLDRSSGRIIGEPRPISWGRTGEVDFDAQADGSKVAYRAVRAGRNELWERSLSEDRERLLLSSPDLKLFKPRWSPDGAKLAFLRCGANGGRPVLALLNADGTGERALTRPHELEMLASDWSNTGESILGSCRFSASDRYSTCLLPVATNSGPADVRIVASDPKRNLFNQRFSPDQKWIAFLAHDLTYSATSTVFVIPSAGGAWRAMTAGDVFDDKPRWGPDGTVLYYVSNRNGAQNVWGRRFDKASGRPVGDAFPVTSFRSPQFAISAQSVQMDIAVTATQLLVPMSESHSDVWVLDHIDG